MNTAEIANSLATVFAELVEGAAKSGGYVLNAGDEGLARSLDKLSAGDASAVTSTGSSIAAHADHLRYGLSLMNRWSGGENPFPPDQSCGPRTEREQRFLKPSRRLSL